MNNNRLRLPKNWAFIVIVNLLIAALLGLLLRYKINYSLRIVNYSYLLHAHSHFVFHAWAGLALISSFVQFLLPKEKGDKSTYGWIFWLMFLASYGMLISFIIQGYGFYSILFSAIAQFVYYWFVIQFIIDSKSTIKNKIIKLFSFASLVALLISTLGPYFLAYFSANISSPLLTKSALYFYLHFQYNGWFSFAILTLFFNWLYNKKLVYKSSYLKWITILFIIGILPGFSLSIIGYVKNNLVILSAYFAVITKIIAVFLLFISILKIRSELNNTLSIPMKILWGISGISVLLKTIMEALLLNQNLAAFAFSYRPLVIGYLHLILLVMLTFYLLGYFIEKGQLIIINKRLSSYSLWGFVIFSLCSELFLFLQASSFLFSIQMTFLYSYNFYITVFIAISLLLLIISQTKYLKR